MFVAISDWILDNNGVVYGCALNNEFRAVHFRATSEKERDLLLGSKYVQSSIGDVYSQIRNDLNIGRKVLFSGTSCQVDGLYSFLGETNIEQLYTVDIVCHGVPSPKIWEEYIAFIEKNYFHKVDKVEFRNKRDFGWADHVESFKLNNGRQINTSTYTGLFYGHYILRPSCHRCPYKSKDRVSDISLADFWGVNKHFPKFNDNAGVSTVIINTEKGKNIFDAVINNLVYKETNWDACMQTAFRKPFSPSADRDAFWTSFYNGGLSESIKRYAHYDMDYVIHNLIPKPLYRLVKRYTLRKKM